MAGRGASGHTGLVFVLTIAQTIENILIDEFALVSDVPGAGALVVNQGEALFKQGFGLADVAEQVPITPATNFRLASVAKQFTAMSVMLLRESGLLSLKQNLCDTFPGFPNYGEAITLRHLLTHSSGLLDYENLLGDRTEPVLDYDVLEIMKQQNSTYFKPGDEFRYSNSGYAVLAMAVEEVSGIKYPDFMHDHIFGPLKMHNTVVYLRNQTHVPHRALGYRCDAGEFVSADQSLTSYVMGDGGVYCSLEDYYKWDLALYSDSLLPQERVAELFQPARKNAGDPVPYGIGWRLDKVGERWIPYHPGNTTGFNNYVRRNHYDGYTVLVLSNRIGRQARHAALAIERLLLDGQLFD